MDWPLLGADLHPADRIELLARRAGRVFFLGGLLLFIGGLGAFTTWAILAVDDNAFGGATSGLLVTQAALTIIPGLCVASGLLVAAGVAFHLYADAHAVRMQLHDELLGLADGSDALMDDV